MTSSSSDLIVKNGTIDNFFDNVRYSTDTIGSLVVDNMLFTRASDDAISTNFGVIKNSVFRNNRFAINILDSAGDEGLVINNNYFYDTRTTQLQDVIFSGTADSSCSNNVVNYDGVISNMTCLQLAPNQCGTQLCQVILAGGNAPVETK